MKCFNRKLAVCVVILVMSHAYSFSQIQRKTIPNSFSIHQSLESDQLNFYIKSIEAADFEQYRLRDATVELNFKNGFKLELISAKELTIRNKMQNVNPNAYAEKSSVPADYVYPVFEITNSGWILAENNAKEVKVKKQ